MTKNEDKKYKVFISYSWSPPAHKDWVRGLAHDLMANGVEVILDQWDISPGNDMNTYMESMVLDKTIDKVIMVCNASYAQKADSRKKGVGIEAQIISKAIYQHTKQDKFIPVISEMDDKGDPYLPVYCKSRFFIDMSNEDRRSEGLEELLRTIYNEPSSPKPEIGNKPNFSSNNTAKISISSIAQRACISMREKKDDAIGVTEDCLSACVEVMEKLSTNKANPKKEVIISHVSEFLPIRNDMVKVFYSMARYLPEMDDVMLLHKFFERILIYYDPGRNVIDFYMPHRVDHFKFLIHEMFLYAIAAFIKRERYGSAAILLDNEYYVPNSSDSQTMLPFSEIMAPLDIEHWDINQEEYSSSGNRVSREAALIKRATVHDLPLIDIQQADLVLAIRSACSSNNEHYPNSFWVPIVVPYVKSHHIFEMFARAQNISYYEKIRDLLGVGNPRDIPQAIEFIHNYMRDNDWSYSDISPAIGIDKLCTRG